MSDIIRLLPDSVANQIAAGEVVQRPSSVVKELLENSVDAGAKHIELWISDAGKSCIQVVDDGKGMSETDARLSFERHATSKIREASDLFDLHTMGFRGEALASIAAVGQVELQTRTASDDTGTSITIEGARFIDQHPIACAVGANIAVRNLFFNVPARRRFLKSNATEMNNVMMEFERVAMINPQISFKLYRDDVLTLDLHAGSLKQRILGLFGQALDKQLLPVSVDTSIVKVNGFVSTPQSAKVKGYKQFFFVNGRFMKHPYFNKAIQSAYERLIPTDKQVSFFIELTVDPQQIDVNIHPTKTEIKFEDDRAIWQILLVATRDALGKFNAVPAIDFEGASELDIPSFRTDSGASEPLPSLRTDYSPFDDKHSFPPSSKTQSTRGWENVYADVRQNNGSTFGFESQEAVGKSEESDSLDFGISSNDVNNPRINQSTDNGFDKVNTNYLQYGTRYIITQVKSGLMIIDFVRAHRRVLYDSFIQNLQNKECVSQSLLFPQLVQVSLAQQELMESILNDLNKVGFDINSVGGGSYAVNGVPAAASNIDFQELITKLLNDYDQQSLNTEMLYRNLAISLARSNSLREGQHLDNQEMTTLVNQLFSCSTPNFGPDGKVIIAIVPHENLTKLFR